MKREVKIGIFGVTMIIAAWAGIRFLKGFDIFSRNSVYYAAYDQINGVQAASPIMMKGVKIGTVTGISFDPQRSDNVVLQFTIKRQYHIPTDSEAKIYSNGLMGGKAIEINYGTARTYLQKGDTLRSVRERDLMDVAGSELDFFKQKVSQVTGDLSRTLTNLNRLMEANAQNISGTLSHLNAITGDMAGLLDAEKRKAQMESEQLKAARNKLSKANGPLFGKLKKCADEAEKAAIQAEIDANNAAVKANAERMARLEEKKANAEAAMNKLLLVIPQIIDESVPIGPDDSCNVEVERFGEPKTPDFDIPYHTEIMERFDGIDMDAAARVSGQGFYYLLGDIARLHSAVTAYGRDFMIDRGFTYCIPPFMIHGNVVEGVMSQTDMDAMMYKIEGEDLYLIGTSEHTMIGRFIDQTLDESKMPLTLTSYSPCFRKEKGAHGIEERGIYRIHQFEKQEMIVVCRPEESADWYEKLWQMSVELFRSMEIPVRQLNCCSGDLADLKVKSCDIEAWSPRQQKYFEVCSCSNLGDAQARRLHIRIKGKDGKTYLAHTLNNTCVAPPRMLIAFLENHLQADGTVTIPEVLRPYMGGKAVLVPNKK